MEKPTTYRTIETHVEGQQYREKGSKFIGIAAPCHSEDEAKSLLESWKKDHQQAGHLCYAYRLGADQSRYRANDDGEPSNSAGAPILGQIQSFDLTNVLIGVVRYYGGTKLGVGGLIHAYRTAAQDAIAAATIIEKEVTHAFNAFFSYADMPFIMNEVKEMDLQITHQQFETDCQLKIAVPLRLVEEFKARLSSFSSLDLTEETT